MSNELTTADNSLREEKIDQTLDSSGATIATTQESLTMLTGQSNIIRTIGPRIIQNFRLIWLDSNIDELNDAFLNCIDHLRRVVNTINTFTNADQCVDFLTEIQDQKAFMIVSGGLGQHIVPLIHDISQLTSIYIFCENQSHHEQWIQLWSKVKGVFTEIVPICEALKQGAQQCDQDFEPISFVSVDETYNQNLDQLDSSFMYTQILKEILFEIDYDDTSIKDFATYCRALYADNHRDLNIIDKFEQEYHRRSPIWFYTHESFIYRILNRALRTQDVDIIIKMGLFIRDLHQQIDRLHSEQFSDEYLPFIVYRGQGLSAVDFEKMLKTRGGLISYNNFLTTSRNRDVASVFAHNHADNPDLIGILFEMTIDPSISSVPFARIDHISSYEDEEEVLFSMHTVFRIAEIKKLENSNRLWQVNLKLTSDNDPLLNALTERMRVETSPGSKGWSRLGELLLKLGEYEKAEQVYAILLDHISDNTEKAILYRQFGWIKYKQAKYVEAISFYQKSIEICQETIPQDHPDLATAYSNISNVYSEMGDYSKALLLSEKALNIYCTTLPPHDLRLTQAYNNIGLVYYNMGEYSRALSLYEKAQEILQETLPSIHPELAIGYNNIGGVYDKMGDYSKAVSWYEKALEIYTKTLPRNHPDLAQTYSNIGFVYYNMGEYSRALSFYEKALEIDQKTLPPNHPDLAKTYNNIGLVYYNMGEYFKALSFYEKALEINQKTLLPNHPLFATSYDNIGLVHNSMGNYSSALIFYQKGLEIRQKALPPIHPDLATSYNNIGAVYDQIDHYSAALSSCEKALEIYQKTLPPNHPLFAISYKNIGSIHNSMGDYSKALLFYEKAVEINQKCLPPNHPSLATFYKNMSDVYNKMGNYSKALSLSEKALDIYRTTLPLHHPDLAQTYNNIDFLSSKMSRERRTTDQKAESPLNRPSSTSSTTVDTDDQNKKQSISDKPSSSSTEKADTGSTSVYYSEPIGLLLEPTNTYKSSFFKQSQVIVTRDPLVANSYADDGQILLKPVSNNKSKIFIVCCDIDRSSILLDSYGRVEFFKDLCACVSRLLSTTDERVYFIVSTSMGQYITPLVYEHRCIEQIYVYCANKEETKADWISQIPKIQNYYTNFDEINAAVSTDIQSILSQSFAWSGNKLLTKFHTRTLVDSSKWPSIPLNISKVVHNLIPNDQIRIVVLHCDRQVLFEATSDRFLLAKFWNSASCVQYLAATDVRSIFFIVSGGIKSVSHQLQSITMLNQIYTVYVLLKSIEENELSETILKYKNVDRLFCRIEDVLTRLAADIKFYAEQSLYMPLLSVFAAPNHTNDKSGFKFSHEQNRFVTFQLFVNILREIPFSNYCQQQLYDRCLAFTENKSDYESALQLVTSDADQFLDWIVNSPFLFAIMNSLLQQQTLNSLLDIQQLIVTVDQHLTELPSTTSSLIVYQAQLVRPQDLERMKTNTGELITFHTHILATKNLITAREIARQAANSGLLVVLFEIGVPTKTRIVKFGEDRIIFQFGNIFRLRSINSAPDGVWYAQLKCADSNFKSVKEKLQLQVGERLTWLTLGSYLCSLNNFNEAKSYYEYLLKMLPDNHEALPSIYNNMGLMFAELDDKEEALKYYNLALGSIKKVSPETDHCAHHIRYKAFPQSTEAKSTVNRSDVYDKIAEIYSHRSELKEAAGFYQKALEQATDSVASVQFEEKIQETLSRLQ